jgi:hypothetical protein
MKKTFFILIMTTTFCFECFAQTDRKNIIKLDIIGALFGYAHINYERIITNKTSLEASFATGGFNLFMYRLLSDFKSVGGNVRWYFSSNKKYKHGVYYLGTGATYIWGNADDGDEDWRNGSTPTKGYTVRAVIGSQSFNGRRIVLDVNAGIQHAYFKATKIAEVNSLGNILPVAQVSVGYRF